MKHILIPLFLFAFAFTAFAQRDRTVYNEEHDWLQGFTRIGVKFSDAGNGDAWYGDVRLGALYNDRWMLGVGGTALASDVDEPSPDFRKLEAFDIWRAGFVGGYRLFPSMLFHLNFELFAGYGQIRPEVAETADKIDIDYWAIEPEVNLTINLTRSWEFGASIGYMIAEGVDGKKGEVYDDDDLSDLTLGVFLRLSEF